MPGTEIRVPSGAKARVQANIAALKLLTALQEAGRPASRDEQLSLAAWSGWGAVPEVFDKRDDRFGGVPIARCAADGLGSGHRAGHEAARTARETGHDS